MVLVYHSSSDSDETVEEVVLQCQGYITRSNLPPVRERNQYVLNICSASILSVILNNRRKRLPSKPTYAQQAVTLSGLGCSGFATFIEAVNSIQKVFERFSGGKTLTGHVGPSIGALLSFSNRYFTQPEETDVLMPVPFSKYTDPFGILQSVSDGVHTSDNEVQYFEQTFKGDKP